MPEVGLTSSRYGTETIAVIGAKSRRPSYGALGISIGVETNALLLDGLRRCQRAPVDALENRVEGFERPWHAEVRQDVAQASGRTTTGFYQWLHRVRRMLLECIRRAMSQEAAS